MARKTPVPDFAEGSTVMEERDNRWSRAAQVGMLMRAYRESCPTGEGKQGLTQAALLERMSAVNQRYAER